MTTKGVIYTANALHTEVVKAIQYEVLLLVKEYFGFSKLENSIFLKTRTMDVMAARHMYTYVLFECNFSVGLISRILGRNHSTVLSSLYKIRHEQKYYEDVQKALNDLLPKVDSLVVKLIYTHYRKTWEQLNLPQK